jgi:hypothetical protein
MKIEVTEKDIRLGKKYNTSNTHCPVARAIRRAGLKNVGVGVEWAGIGIYNKTVKLPVRVVNFIKRLCDSEKHDTLKPFTFTLTTKQVAVLRGN